ncbi:MAG: tetratricopeptide repeat protein, partial [Ignavibacteria bacterium]
MNKIILFLTIFLIVACQNTDKNDRGDFTGLSSGKQDTVSMADSLFSSGKFSECKSLLFEFLDNNKSKLSSIDSIDAYNLIAASYRKLGNYDSAKAYLDSNFIINSRADDTLNLSIAQTHYLLGLFYKDFEEVAESEKHLMKALEIRKLKLSPDDPLIGDVYNNLGVLYHIKSDFEKAEVYLRNALRLRKKRGLFDKSVASTYMNLGNIYINTFELQKSLVCFDSALIIQMKTIGENHPLTGSIHLNRAGLLLDLGLYDSSQTEYDRALTIFKNTIGEEHPYVAALYNNIANAYLDIGDYRKVISYLNKSINIKERKSKKSIRSLLDNYSNLAYSYIHLKQFEEAKKRIDRIDALFKKIENPGLFDYFRFYQLKINFYAAAGQFAKASNVADEAIKIISNLPSGDVYLKKMVLIKYQAITEGNLYFINPNELDKYIEYFSNLYDREWVLYAKQIKLSILFKQNKFDKVIAEIDSQIKDLNNGTLANNYSTDAFIDYFIDNIELGILSLNKIYRDDKSTELLAKITYYSETALKQLERIYHQLSGEESKQLSSNKIRRIVEHGVYAEYQLYTDTKDINHLTKALSLFESARALSLQEKINLKKFYSTSGVPERILNEENELLRQKLSLRRKLKYEITDGKERKDLENSLDNVIVKLDSLNKYINKNYKSAKEFGAITNKIELDSVKKMISAGRSILNYLVAENDLYL